MPDELALALGDTEIRRATGGGAFARGAEYARQGRVSEVVYDPGEMSLRGLVRGSGRRTYVTEVQLVRDAGGGAQRGALSMLTHETWCSCPVGYACKHAAALMLVVRARYATPRTPTAAEVPLWERHLATLLRGVEGSSATETTPVALQFDLGARSGLPVRPVQWGRSGTWVRSGISWDELRWAGVHRNLQPRHLELLKDFERLAPSSYGYRRAAAIDLAVVGRGLWALLDQAQDVGLPLVTTGRRPEPVTVSREAADVRLDVARAAADADIRLRAEVRLGEQCLDPAALEFLGSPAHGCFLRQDPDAGELMLVRFERPLPPALQQFLEHASQLNIPAADAERFVADYYPRLRHAAPIGSEDASVPLPVVTGPRLRLTVTFDGTATLSLSWGFVYDVDGRAHRHPLHGPGDDRGVRDRAAEAELVATVDLPNAPVPLLADGGGGSRIVAEQVLDGMASVMFTEQMLPRLQDSAGIDVEVVGAVPQFRPAQDAPRVDVSATDTNDRDWFDLGVTVTVEGHEVEFGHLFAALAAGESHLLLDNGTYFPLDDSVFDSLARLIAEARTLNDHPGEGLRINPFQAGLWEELVELGVVEEQSQRWAEKVDGLLDLDAMPEAEIPAGIEAELRPYQLHGYRWLRFLWDHELGGILADDMGLGKTVQTLALVSHARRQAGSNSPFLVVAPTSVVGNWSAEARRFAPGLHVVTVNQSERKRDRPLAEVAAGADLVVTSYALFRIDAEHYQALQWSALMLDEAQFVKNHRAKTYQCARALKAPFKLAITGTPLENSLMDLWAMLSIVAPGLFPQPKVFADLYAKPIERGDADMLATLRRRVRPLLLRRTKEQVATELPPKQESVLSVELTPRHRKIYETHLHRERQKILGLIDDMDKNRFTILRSLTLLRQLSLDPALIDDTYDGVGSAKIDVLLEQLEEVVGEGHRALVFSQFTGFLRRVRDRLDSSGIGYSYLDGRTRKRAQAIEAFTEGDVPVFVISLKAGGFGLNLTQADYCYVLDPWWNPAVEAQAVDRTHRIGQERTVMVYRLVSHDTIETKVMELKARKQQLFASVMDGDGGFGGALTADDIRGLLGP